MCKTYFRSLTGRDHWVMLVAFVFLMFHYGAYSQSGETHFHELTVKGVPFNKNINVLFEDSFGFLWIGCNTGLYRYDGNTITEYQYDSLDPNSIPNNNINSIVEDPDKNLWIGSESYLIFYSRKKDIFKGFYKNSRSDALYLDSQGFVWSNRKKTGLIKITPHQSADSIKFETYFNYIHSSTFLRGEKKIVNSMTEDNLGRKWVGTPQGIFGMTPDNLIMPTSFDKHVKSLKKFDDDLFMALTNKGLYILKYNATDYTLQVVEAYSTLLKADHITPINTSMAVTSDGNLWIGTTHGLLKGERKRSGYEFNCFSSSNTKGSLLNNQVNTLTMDSYENLWIGTLKGINKYVGRTSVFEHHPVRDKHLTKNTLVNRFITCGKDVYLSTSTGIYRYNQDSNTSEKLHETLDNIKTIKFNYEKDGFYIAHNNSLYRTGSLKIPDRSDGLKFVTKFNKIIMDMACIRKNEVWVGLWEGGVQIFNGNNPLSPFQEDVVRKTAMTHVSVMLRDRSGNLWVGARGEGLFKINPDRKTITHYTPSKENSLSSDAILSLLEDEQHNIWIGTRGGGLNRYNPFNDTFTSYTKKDGLRSNTISAVQKDMQGNIWVSTNAGLARFDINSKKFMSFGIEDGIGESEFIFNSGSANGGHLYFGHSNGFYSVNTNKYSQTDIVPLTVITSFNAMGPSEKKKGMQAASGKNRPLLNSESPIVLPFDRNNINIEFSSLDLTAPQKNKYAYMLEGVNDYWIYAHGPNNSVNYNDLLPRTYTFKVKSTNSDGVWNETPASLTFEIIPPVWLSKWAIAGYAILGLLLLGVAFILVKRWYRLKKKLVKETISREKDNEHNRMKMIFFTDISHELRTPLSLIMGSIEKVVRNKDFTLNPLAIQRLHNNSIRMQRLIDQIMDIRKFDAGGFRVLASKNNAINDIRTFKNAFNDFAKIYHIQYSFIHEDEEIKAWYDTEILEKILFNLLSNAFKYTPEKGEITVTAQKARLDDAAAGKLNLSEGKYLVCSIRDNGVGIPGEELGFIFDRYYQSTKLPGNQIPGTGIGMELVQKLITSHHGAIEVESEEDVYTEFTFYLPVSKKQYPESEILKANGKSIKRHPYKSNRQIIAPPPVTEGNTVPKPGNKPKILLVEDHVELRTMMKEELRADFHVLEASDGREGYALATEKTPQLIISDILMPVEDGIGMLKKIKENTETNHIPVFMLTARDSDDVKVQCLSLGADDYIEKPFSLDFVKWKVKNTLLVRRQLKEKYSKVITGGPSEIEIPSVDEKFIKKLVTIIENSMDDNLLSVEYLASEVGMSRANLYRKLQAIAGETPVNFIKKIRLKRGAQLLKNNNLYISEVAYMTGFRNQKYFSNCFKKEYGMAPKDYARQYADRKKTVNNVPVSD
ncbi:two-component regulator propeller domain-containing protein [Sinomicrobium weinanense]|uniref:histidine kinase n=1 Tax=Sinomicrobium weinanense TaxID=2842200 RepID=A0A926JTD4_9FLAO|nr:two-component regulator propeller domain-containing protein [Sinomicrobium weinanense]MBC9797175.1 response regulator [Sinomicrobium weinanense]MBU3125849.1 response regulator [Sinomicrobium weinanense]